MKQEEKSLSLKDLCARLPYNLYIRVEEFNVPKNEAITEGFVGNYLKDNRCNDYDADDILNELADGFIDIKPYLRPMSSMTEEEIVELKWLNEKCDAMPTFEYVHVENYRIYDWMNRHHFDYRGLIEKGLALEAQEGMYK